MSQMNAAALNELNVKVAEHEVRLGNVEQQTSEQKNDIREMRALLWSILVTVIGTLLSIVLPKLPWFR